MEPPEARDVVLADGGSARVRPATPEDAPRVAAFHEALSLETVHFRYFSGLTKLPRLILERFTRVNFERDMVLVAELGERIIALASYHRGPTADQAEVAFVVADEHQGRGLGTLLLEELAELARERGVTRFRADTLAGNRDMLRVFRDAGYELERAADGGVVHMRFPVSETARARDAHAQREHLAEARSVARMLAPRSLWLAGERAGDAQRLRALGFRGELSAGAGAPPEGVDLVLYAGPAAGLPELVAACARARVHALVVGELRGEPAGAERDAFDGELRVAVRRGGMRLVGPASLGLVNTAPELALVAARVALAPRRGGLALACDADCDGTALLDGARAAGVGISSFVSLGRRVDVSANDLLQFWQDDPATRAVALAVGSVGNAAKFARIGARIAATKSLLALASGRTEEDAALARAGASLARSPAELWARARERV